MSYGIDVSSESFTVSQGVLFANTKNEISHTCSFTIDVKGFKSFLKYVNSLNKKYQSNAGIQPWFVMETTGVYYEKLAHFLNDKGFNVSVVLANKMKAFCRVVSPKSRTDEIDSRTIALYGLERQLQKWDPPSEFISCLKELSREANDLNEQVAMIKNRLHAKKHSHKPDQLVIKRLKDQITFLKKQNAQVKKQINDVVKTNKAFSEKVKKITLVKGLREYTVVSVVAEMNEFKHADNKRQVVSYAGLDLKIDQSGKKDSKRRISKQGNSNIRRALYMPALSSKKHEKKLKLLYDRLCQRYNFKDKKRAIVAVMRKLLILIYTLWKNDTAYDPDYYLFNKSIAI